MSSLISILFVIFCLVSAFHKNSSRTNRDMQRRPVPNQMPKYTAPAYQNPEYTGQNNQKKQTFEKRPAYDEPQQEQSDTIRTQNRDLQRRKMQAQKKQQEQQNKISKVQNDKLQNDKMETCTENMELFQMDTFGLGMPNQELGACMKEVNDLIVTGYHPKMPEVRDFMAEGLSMLGE